MQRISKKTNGETSRRSRQQKITKLSSSRNKRHLHHPETQVSWIATSNWKGRTGQTYE